MKMAKHRHMSKLLAEARARVERMSPEERSKMLDEQANSWALSMEPCEHGVRDWETCPDCRRAALETQKDAGQ